MKQNDSKAKRLGMTQREYRLAYGRWKAAINRGHKVKLKIFLQNKRVRLVPTKGKVYSRAKQKFLYALATPKWVNIDAMCAFYANRPEGYHVDHIVPICGENVCGLNVPWNLQYLPAKSNLDKRNKH
jgi:hypothetical protein